MYIHIHLCKVYFYIAIHSIKYLFFFEQYQFPRDEKTFYIKKKKDSPQSDKFEKSSKYRLVIFFSLRDSQSFQYTNLHTLDAKVILSCIFKVYFNHGLIFSISQLVNVLLFASFSFVTHYITNTTLKMSSSVCISFQLISEIIRLRECKSTRPGLPVLTALSQSSVPPVTQQAFDIYCNDDHMSLV